MPSAAKLAAPAKSAPVLLMIVPVSLTAAILLAPATSVMFV
jgi:hypothetical protein